MLAGHAVGRPARRLDRCPSWLTYARDRPPARRLRRAFPAWARSWALPPPRWWPASRAYVIVALYYWHVAAGRARSLSELAMTVAVLYSGGLCARRHPSPPGRTASERFLMPLFEQGQKPLRDLHPPLADAARRHDGGVRGAGRAALSAPDPRRRPVHDEAEDNRVNQRLIAPPRGRILDRFGVELANNRRNYRVLLVAEQATEGVEAALDTIGKVIQLTDAAEEARAARHRAEQEIRAGAGRREPDLGRVRPHQLHLPYLPGIQPDVGRDARLSLWRRA